MTIKDVLSGAASAQESRKFWAICQLVGFGIFTLDVLLIAILEYHGTGIFDLAVVAGFVLATVLLRSWQSPPRYVERGLVAVTGLLMLGYVWGLVFRFDGTSYGTFNIGASIGAVGFLLIVLPAPSLVGRVLASRGTDNYLAPSVDNSAERPQQAPGTSLVEPDIVLYIAAGGAAAVILSLLAFPWFALENFDWNDAVNITFNDLRSVYNIAKDEGLNGDVRFFYLEWGYIVSYASAIVSPFLAMRLRDKKTFEGVALLNVGIGLTGLVGLWLAVLATGLSELDDEGSVQIGMWLGVAGHVALVVALVLIRQAVVAGSRSTAAGS